MGIIGKFISHQRVVVVEEEMQRGLKCDSEMALNLSRRIFPHTSSSSKDFAFYIRRHIRIFTTESNPWLVSLCVIPCNRTTLGRDGCAGHVPLAPSSTSPPHPRLPRPRCRHSSSNPWQTIY